MIATRRLFLASRIKLYAALQTGLVATLVGWQLLFPQDCIAPLLLLGVSVVSSALFLQGMKEPLNCVKEIKRVIAGLHPGELGSRTANAHGSAYQLLSELKKDWHHDQETREVVLSLYKNIETAGDAVMDTVGTMVAERSA